MTKNISDLIQMLKEHDLCRVGMKLAVTGGGAYKFETLFKSELGVQICHQDEMETLVNGIEFVMGQSNEFYKYDDKERRRIPGTIRKTAFPFLLVNIGSGVSIIHARAPGVYERVTGTCVGGGTVLGLAHLLVGAQSFDEIMDLSSRGTTALDLTVADLCGDAAGSRVLPSDTLASSFGRVYAQLNEVAPTNVHVSPPSEPRVLAIDAYNHIQHSTQLPSDDEEESTNFSHIEDKYVPTTPLGRLPSQVRREDVARSLVEMVSYNLGYVALLVSRMRRLGKVLFAGKFIADHEPTVAAINRGVRFYANHYSRLLTHEPSPRMPSPALFSPLPPSFVSNMQLSPIVPPEDAENPPSKEGMVTALHEEVFSFSQENTPHVAHAGSQPFEGESMRRLPPLDGSPGAIEELEGEVTQERRRQVASMIRERVSFSPAHSPVLHQNLFSAPRDSSPAFYTANRASPLTEPAAQRHGANNQNLMRISRRAPNNSPLSNEVEEESNASQSLFSLESSPPPSSIRQPLSPVRNAAATVLKEGSGSTPNVLELPNYSSMHQDGLNASSHDASPLALPPSRRAETLFGGDSKTTASNSIGKFINNHTHRMQVHHAKTTLNEQNNLTSANYMLSSFLDSSTPLGVAFHNKCLDTNQQHYENITCSEQIKEINKIEPLLSNCSVGEEGLHSSESYQIKESHSVGVVDHLSRQMAFQQKIMNRNNKNNDDVPPYHHLTINSINIDNKNMHHHHQKSLKSTSITPAGRALEERLTAALWGTQGEGLDFGESDGEFEEFLDLEEKGVVIAGGDGTTAARKEFLADRVRSNLSLEELKRDEGRFDLTCQILEGDLSNVSEAGSSSHRPPRIETHFSPSIGVVSGQSKHLKLDLNNNGNQNLASSTPVLKDREIGSSSQHGLAPDVLFITHDGDLGSVGAFLLLLKQSQGCINT